MFPVYLRRACNFARPLIANRGEFGPNESNGSLDDCV